MPSSWAEACLRRPGAAPRLTAVDFSRKITDRLARPPLEIVLSQGPVAPAAPAQSASAQKDP